jgi:hypothetical protein
MVSNANTLQMSGELCGIQNNWMMVLPDALGWNVVVVGRMLQHTVQQVSSTLANVVEQAVWQMSSTLKKRKAKMNKHKLRKRRKKERKKSK